MKVYKVVCIVDDERVSISVPVDLGAGVVYRPDVRAFPKVAGSPLFACRIRAHARELKRRVKKHFLRQSDVVEIWKAEAEEYESDPPIIKSVQMPDGLSYAVLSAFWAGRRPYAVVLTTPPDVGTVMCKSLTLTEKVS